MDAYFPQDTLGAFAQPRLPQGNGWRTIFVYVPTNWIPCFWEALRVVPWNNEASEGPGKPRNITCKIAFHPINLSAHILSITSPWEDHPEIASFLVPCFESGHGWNISLLNRRRTVVWDLYTSQCHLASSLFCFYLVSEVPLPMPT